jgi:uncharacterized protein DUF4255
LATYHAIAATGQAILALLSDACPRDEFPDARFDLYQTSSFQKPMDEGVSLYLYQVSLSASRRNVLPGRTPDGRRLRPALPVDLHYLLSAWSKSAARQQRLLGWCMRTIDDTTILPSGLLNHAGPERDVFGPTETVELICEPHSLQDLVNIQDPLKPNVPLSVGYVARMVALESTVELVEGPPVQTRAFDVVPEATP